MRYIEPPSQRRPKELGTETRKVHRPFKLNFGSILGWLVFFIILYLIVK